jgi:hypothetical protein
LCAGEAMMTREELLRQGAELLPSRNMMHVIGRRFKKKKYPIPPPEEREGIACVRMVGYYPPGHPCFDGHYHPPRR